MKRIALTVGALIILSAISLVWLTTAPSDFPQYRIVSIPQNIGLTGSASILKTEHIVRSEILFKVIALVIGGRRSMKSGDYLFDTPVGVWTVARRLVSGEQGLSRVKVTFPEGATTREMGKILTNAIPGFDADDFYKKASPDEGYIFPDTYFFFPNVTVDEVVKTARKEFDEKTSSLATQIKASGRSLHDIIIMASIVEKEGVDDASRHLIAGILWKRLDRGVRLQIDSPFLYSIGKSSDKLTLADLALDSPYNTYRRDGLPAGPISNPGLSAIDAAIHPTASPYWFFLSDSKNVFHYARTFAEHVANKQKYLQ